MYTFGGNTLTESYQDTWRVDLSVCVSEGEARWEKVEVRGEVGLCVCVCICGTVSKNIVLPCHFCKHAHF